MNTSVTTTVTAKKILPCLLYATDQVNLALLLDATAADSEAEAIRDAIKLATWYRGLRSAEDIGFYPPVKRVKK